ncbi:hypothetical protein [Teichococcus oryzae]|uniref:hypothetical protein n=1 Tax=Teichococcus oryzae TaxID=1608942 RepID=UPI001576D9C3|nr:hypothetical protein [Pseudoroseomonas oryzae]
MKLRLFAAALVLLSLGGCVVVPPPEDYRPHHRHGYYGPPRGHGYGYGPPPGYYHRGW